MNTARPVHLRRHVCTWGERADAVCAGPEPWGQSPVTPSPLPPPTLLPAVAPLPRCSHGALCGPPAPQALPSDAPSPPGPPPRPPWLLQRLCSRLRLSLLILGLNVLLLVAVCVIGSQSEGRRGRAGPGRGGAVLRDTARSTLPCPFCPSPPTRSPASRGAADPERELQPLLLRRLHGDGRSQLAW